MNWFTDNPIPLFVLGLFAQVFLGVALWQSGRHWILWLMAFCACVSGGLLVAENVISSPAEEITHTLGRLAAAIQTNDPANVVTFVAPEATQIRSSAEREMKRVVISEAFVAGTPKIEFSTSVDGKSIATASFLGRFKAKFVRETTPYEQAIVRFKLYFRQEGDRWLVTNYELNRN
jgi:hypothetical protein